MLGAFVCSLTFGLGDIWGHLLTNILNGFVLEKRFIPRCQRIHLLNHVHALISHLVHRLQVQV